MSILDILNNSLDFIRGFFDVIQGVFNWTFTIGDFQVNIYTMFGALFVTLLGLWLVKKFIPVA